MANLSGQVLKSYEVLEQLGTGGFGAVYKAVQPVIGREVAIKVILPEYANRPDFIRRFESEAQVVARLEHPHIVPLYDYWREPNSAYLVMRYLRGGSLRDIIDENGALDILSATQLVAQIASALSFAHRNGVVHRDLKTDNILVDDNGNYYLSDFGIAKDLTTESGLTRDSILGTPAYLSPEQIRGEKVTAKSDIYALGILIYEALTGAKPFFDVTPATILYKQLNDPLPDLQEMRPDLPPELNQVLQRATAKQEDLRYDDTLELAREFQNIVRGVTTGKSLLGNGTVDIKSITDLGEAVLNATNPYKGLRAFQQSDSADFFGRKVLCDRLVGRFNDKHSNSNFLAVVGPSGSGKSSVVKAGLLPLLKEGALNEDSAWFVGEMVPGTHPFEELEATLLSLASSEMPNLLTQLREDSRGLVRAVKRILPDDKSQLVLLIDQFEELFTLVDEEDERVSFLNTLLATVNDSRSRMVVIVTLRADFYDKPLLYGDFGELIRQRTELVLPLNPQELESAIVSPLSRIGMSAEPGLVSAIIKEVSQQPGALPLLQYALTELFERREGRLITLKAYQEIGGTSGALAKRAEELYSRFTLKEQQATRQLFLRLVTLGEGTEDTRRRVVQRELFGIDEHSNALREVIDLFGRYRLLTFDHDPLTRNATVEVAHEALIRQWERLRGWLDENREGLRLHRRLTSASEDWLQSNRDKSFLARGARLERWADWSSHTDIALNEIEREYLKISLEERDAQLKKEKEREERERQLEQRAQRFLRAFAIFASIAAVAGIVLASVAITQRQAAVEAQAQSEQSALEALRARDETSSLALASNARNALVNGDTRLALSLALESKNAYTPQTAEVMRVLASTTYSEGARYQLNSHADSVLVVAASPDNTLFLSSGRDNQIMVYEIATGQTRFSIALEDAFATDAQFSPTEALFAVTLSNGEVRLYSSTDGALIATLGAHEDVALTLDFSNDGQILASGGQDRLVRLWDVRAKATLRIIEGHVGAILQVTFNSDGTRLATTTADETVKDDRNDLVDRLIRLWDVETGEKLLEINPQSGFLRALAFSPDNKTLAVGMWDSSNSGTIRFYDSATGEETRRLFAHNDNVTDIAYSQDGTLLYSASWDKSVRVWDVSKGIQRIGFTAFEERPLSLAVTPDSDYLVIGLGNAGNNYNYGENSAINTSVFLWDLRRRDEQAHFTLHKDWVWTVDINADGTLIASAGGPLRLPADMTQTDVSVRVWERATGKTIATLEAHTNTIDSLKFLPNGQLLSSGWDGNVYLWDVTEAQVLRTFSLPLFNDAPNSIYKIAVSPDGKTFLTGSQDGVLRLWDVSNGELLRSYEGHTSAINGVAFSPDGALVASASGDKTIKLWHINGELLHTYEGHAQTVNEVLFTPDGTGLISTSWDDSVRLWNIETKSLVRQFVGHTENTFGIALTRDNQHLLTTSTDRTIRLWEISTGEELHRYLGHTDWIQEVVLTPDETLLITGAQDKTVRIWELALTADQLETFAKQNRVIRPLTCAERASYRLNLCP